MKTTIKTITEKTYQGKVTGHLIELENGVTGYLDDKGSSEGLRVGDSVDYVLEVKKNKKGGEYNLLTLTLSSQTTVTPPPPVSVLPPVLPPPKVDIAEWKFKSRMQLCELTHRFVIEGKLTDIEARQHIKDWSVLMDELIDGIFS